MTKKPDKMAATEAAWTKAIAREALIRPLASATRIPAARLASVCRDLGLKRTRLCELIALYRAAPVASSLLDAVPGQEKGSRRLSAEVEHIIEAGVRAPTWKAVALRVQQADQQAVYRDREGAKASRQRFAPVVQEYKSDYAFQIVQIDHTLVDLFIVDTVHRRPLQRPWLTLAIDVASRMVARFYLSLESPSSTSVALVIQQLVLPKGPWLKEITPVRKGKRSALGQLE